MSAHVKLKNVCGMIGGGLFCISSVAGTMIAALINTSVLYVIYSISIVLTIYSITNQGVISIAKQKLNTFLLWYIFVAVFIIFYNEGVRHASYFNTVRWLYYFLYMIIVSFIPRIRYRDMLKGLGFITGIYILFVYFFMLFPQTYQMMFKLWGYWPTGTNRGMNGYRAGLASHYSENAMCIVIAVFVIISFWLVEKRRIAKTKLSVILVIAVTALILTTKRAHLLFGFLTIVFAYYIFRPEHRGKHIFKIVLWGAVGLSCFYALSFYIPAISATVERFSTIGEDTESTTRFAMWALALNNFRENPIFGIGWNGYKYQFFRYLFDPRTRAERYAYLNAHNVYLQLLAETGIFGFTLFVSCAIKIFRKTILVLNNKLNAFSQDETIVLLFSIMTQTFFCLYCFTGNCLYDIMFSFYAVAVGMAIGCSCQKMDKQSRLEVQECH